MSVSCLNQVALEYVDGRSDKLYIIQTVEAVTPGGSEYQTNCYYGRRGSALSLTNKYKGPSSASAQAASDRMEREKRGKGYTTMAVAAGARIPGMPSSAPVFGGASVASASAAVAAAVATGPLPLLAQVADKDRIDALLASPDWAMQQKYDGERVLLSLRRSAIQAYNRKGIARTLTAKAEAEFKPLLARMDFSDERETIVDGELMGDVYIIYDILFLRDNDIRDLSFEERFAALDELLCDNMGLLAPTAWAEEEKRAMLDTAISLDQEGVMFRGLCREYRAGRQSSLLKHKLWATCTCRVLTANVSRRSMQVAVRDETGAEVFVGNVTVPVNQDIPETDGLVEVRYLYAMEGGSLYQPTLLGCRDDIEEADTRDSLRPAPPEKRGAVEAEAV